MTMADMLARLEELEGELEELWGYFQRAGVRTAIRHDILTALHYLLDAKRTMLAEVV